MEKILQAEEIAKTIFRCNVFLMVSKEPLPENSLTEEMGYYNFFEDKITIYLTKMQQIANKFDINFEKMITYTVCHEYGHAKQARMFEDKNVFPVS